MSPPTLEAQESALAQRLAALLIALGALGLYTERRWDLLVATGASELNQGATVGRVQRMHSGVRYRPFGSVLWREFLGDISDAKEGDAIFTDAEGLARLELRNGVTADIHPNSLVVIRQAVPPDLHADGMKTVLSMISNKQQPVLDIGAGGMSVSFKAEATVGIQAGDKGRSFISSQGHASVEAARETLEDGQVRLSAPQSQSQGAILVEATDEPVELNPGETVNVTTGDPVKPEPKLTSSVEPEDGAILFVLPKEPIRVAWKWKSTFVERGDTLFLNLEGPLSKLEPVDPDATAWKQELPPGVYHWRLEIMRDQYVYRTAKATFEVRKFEAPRLLGPADGAQLFEGKAGGAPISLTYEKLSRGVTSEIEVIDEEGKQGSKILPGNALGAEVSLQKGRYRWRARAFAGEKHEFDSAWSPYFRFALTAVAPAVPRVPQLEGSK